MTTDRFFKIGIALYSLALITPAILSEGSNVLMSLGLIMVGMSIITFVIHILVIVKVIFEQVPLPEPASQMAASFYLSSIWLCNIPILLFILRKKRKQKPSPRFSYVLLVVAVIASLCPVIASYHGITVFLGYYFWVGAIWVFWWSAKKSIKTWRQARIRCTVCGYSLQGLTDPRCPECGESFEARLLLSPLDQPSNLIDE